MLFKAFFGHRLWYYPFPLSFGSFSRFIQLTSSLSIFRSESYFHRYRCLYNNCIFKRGYGIHFPSPPLLCLSCFCISCLSYQTSLSLLPRTTLIREFCDYDCLTAPVLFAHQAVTTGTRMAVTMTQVATSMVAAGATGAYDLSTAAIAAGTAAALPAVDAAAMPAKPLPPVILSTRIRTVPVIATTETPIRMPRSPAVQTFVRLSPQPRANAKKGINTGTARLKK